MSVSMRSAAGRTAAARSRSAGMPAAGPGRGRLSPGGWRTVTGPSSSALPARAWTSAPELGALVSGGVVRPVRAPFLARMLISDVATAGADDAWLAAGGGLDRSGRFRRLVAARWDGTSWHQVPLPAGVRALYSLST